MNGQNFKILKFWLKKLQWSLFTKRNYKKPLFFDIFCNWHKKLKVYMITFFLLFREVNEDNQLIRNVLVEFEDSLKYVSLK